MQEIMEVEYGKPVERGLELVLVTRMICQAWFPSGAYSS